MASLDNLLVSWNFDNLTNSTSEEVQVSDTVNEYSGKGTFYVTKDAVKTNKKLLPDVINGIETIQIREEDDVKVNFDYKKPSSIQVHVENSMYQIVSEEMLRMFSNISDYAYQYSESKQKYGYNYPKIDALRKYFFKKVANKPDIEKYVEFYKWLDSSLGYMVEQLLPENSGVKNGLKPIIESHILERNKYQHKLTHRVQPSSVFTNAEKISVTDSDSLSNSSAIQDIKQKEQIKVIRIDTANQTFDTAGKTINHRNGRTGKGVMKTSFSSVDGHETTEEVSSYNSLLNRNRKLVDIYNISQSNTTGIQGGYNHTEIICEDPKTKFTEGTVQYPHSISINGIANKTRYEVIPSPYAPLPYYSIARIVYVPKAVMESHLEFLAFKSLYDNNGNVINTLDIPSATYNISAPIQEAITYRIEKFVLKNAGQKPNPAIAFTMPEDGYVLLNREDGAGLTNYGTYSSNADTSIHIDFNILGYTYAIDLAPESCVTESYGYLAADNNFISRNIPLLDRSFTNKQDPNYQNIPTAQLESLKGDNYFYKNTEIYPKDEYIRESPIQFSLPIKQKLKVSSGVRDIDIFSPYGAMISKFSADTTVGIEMLSEEAPDALNVIHGSIYSDTVLGTTFFHKTQENSSSYLFKNTEHLENIYPSPGYAGSKEVRTKPEYEEIIGTFNTSSLIWSNNSYNHNSALIRSFWGTDRDRLPYTYMNNNGSPSISLSSYNCLNYINLDTVEQSINIISSSFNNMFLALTDNTYKYLIPLNILKESKYLDSIYCLDSLNAYSFINTYEYLDLFLVYAPIVNLTLTNSLLGDLSPYSHWQSYNFLKLQPGNIRPKPEFIHNVYPGWQLESSGSSKVLNLLLNDSYQNGVDPLLKPKYDTYISYFDNIKHLAQNRGNIPEYTVSNYDKLILGDKTYFYGSDKNYLKYLGTEKYRPSIDTRAYIVDFNKFINKDSNKIKIQVSGIKKLLPYNGFYPSQRTVQIVEKFNKCYIDGEAAGTAVQKQALIQPLFAPGILFNTIKSGIAVDFPILINDTVNLESFLTQSSNDKSADSSLYLLKKLSNRLPFETILEPKQRYFDKFGKDNNPLIYLNPTHHSQMFFSGSANSVANTARLQRILNVLPASDFEYRLTINNFLAETPNFFLQDNTLTYIQSLPQEDFKQFTSGSQYLMRLEMQKKENFSMFSPFFQNSAYELPIQSVFGPPVDNGDRNIFNPLSYQPYSPPYYNNSSYIDISFTPSETRKYTLEEIFNGIVVTTASLDGYANNNRMTVESCVNLLQKTKDKKTTFDAITGAPLETTDGSSYKWTIQTKFETPIINYKNSVGSNSEIIDIDAKYYSKRINNGSMDYNGNDLIVKTIKQNISGIWNRLGSVPEDKQGIELRLVDVPDSGSLIEQCGFAKAVPKSIGVLADNKKISEAVVLLPYVNADFGDYSTVVFNDAEDRFMFRLDEASINRVLGIPNYKALHISQLKDILEKKQGLNRNNSIYKLMKGMVEYNIPPHLNWLYDKNIQPFVMYIVEFDHVLDKNDLSSIWQGTLPKIGTTPEEQTVTFEHFIAQDELMYGTGINDLQKDYQVEMSIFKVKQRANRNYFEMTANIEDDQKYRFTGEEEIPWYSYNWPYDYFSLVELINVSAGEVYSSDKPE
jgi:hypothetical protein